MSWQEEADELAARRAWAEELGGTERVDRQHAEGRLTVRQRIENLIDPGSLTEVGKLTGTGTYDDHNAVTGVRPAPYVCGVARIDGRPVCIGGEDFTVRGGTSWGPLRRKGGQGGFIEDFAQQYRMPLINLIDGAGGSVTSAKSKGYTVFPGIDGWERSVRLMGEIPVVGAVLGSAAGGPAGRAILGHWSIMVRGTSHIFAAGPPVVKRSLGEDVNKEELGGAAVAVDVAGTVDNAVDSEDECFAAVRKFLSFMPQNVWEAPPVVPNDDPIDRCEDKLLDIVPKKRTRPYNMHKLVDMVFDKDSVFEIQPTYGKAAITSLARLGGYPVGIVANNPMIYAGAMDVASARKQTHFIDLCDTFHIPLIYLVDVPGFMVGTKAELAGTLRDGMRAMVAGLQATVPTLTLVIRKCYGMAGNGTMDKDGIDFKIAWPSGEWGSLPIEGGVAAAYRRDIEAAPDPKAREAEIEAEIRAYASPFRSAEAFAVEDVIDPRETRPYLHRFVELAQTRIQTQLGPKFRTGVRP
jgi:acetyl-CoA carboxylase carboxyltransferase component